MDIQENEKRRARNQVWTAAEEYDFEPPMKVYDAQGRADLYWNTVAGVARREWGEALEPLFASFKPLIDCQYYEQLAWLALESAAFLCEQDRRPALPALRRSYARRALAEFERAPTDYLVHILTAGRCREILGLDPGLTVQQTEMLHALDLPAGLDGQEMAERVRSALTDYFSFRPVPPAEEKKRPDSRPRWLPVISFRRSAPKQLPSVRGFGYGFSEHVRDQIGAGGEAPKRRLTDMSAAQTEAALHAYMAAYFGAPLYSDEQVKKLERELCTGDHKDCNLYFARGDDTLDKKVRGYAGARRRAALKQMEQNRAAYDADLTRNRASIARLTARIRNAMLAHLQPTVARGSVGVLDAPRVWRAEALGDEKVFLRTLRGDPGDLCVDILLDSSSSQTQRQETVSAQGYMIAESLTRCGIPVRVTAFCSLSGYTVLTRFRDYEETDRNEYIFHYFTTGCNRDGLAIRALGHELESAPFDHRLVIILSDCKPNDVIKVSRDGQFLDYAAQTGILNTAREVRRITRTGAAVICVFTGDDEDLPAARTIYGRNFTRIRRLDQFADTVGSLIQNQIRNL